MHSAIASQRQTKYCKAVETTLAQMGHATNTELLRELRGTYPDLSATTIHRITSRLTARGTIAVAPPTPNGAMRYDINTTPHDHFLCLTCDILRDTDVKDKVIPMLESSIEGCHISGRLTISGMCKKCKGE